VRTYIYKIYPENNLNPLSPKEIIELISDLKLELLYQNNVQINEKHSLFVFVFEK
jgi:hypothetical protein